MHAALIATLCAVGLGSAVAADADRHDLAQETLAKTAAMLPARPGLGAPPVADRRAWERVSRRPDVSGRVARAEALLRSPMPELTDELYLDYSRTGNRRRCETVLGERRSRLTTLALAECLEARGRFLPALEAAVRSTCAERSWVMPAHDGLLQTFRGTLTVIDLGAATLAGNLGAIDALLGDRLAADTRALLRAELRRRIFEPFRRMCAGQQSQYWLTMRSNWNAVCLAGVTCAALASIDSAEERAWFVLQAEHFSRWSLEGFTPDGYCDEGVGYWNYGFGHYVALSETLRRATHGGIDLLARPEAVMPAAYGSRIEIAGGVCPAFADCDVAARPYPALMDILSRRFLGRALQAAPTTITGGLGDEVAALFPGSCPRIRTAARWPQRDPMRTWFPDPAVYIGRPGRRAACRLSVAFQGGHNAQNHNHNDVGAFMALVDGIAVLPDIGAEVYTARTFGPRRYDSPALNSWGHAAPVVAGRLQSAGRKAEARVLEQKLSTDVDSLTLDLKAAYEAPGLTRLERRFAYDRRGAGALTITDTFAYDSPAAFETALLTFGSFERLDASRLRIMDQGRSVIVTLESPAGIAIGIAAETVAADLTARRPATRIALRLEGEHAAGSLTVNVRPEQR